MAIFTVIDLSEAPSPFITLPCEACGMEVTRTLRHHRRLQRHPRGRGAAFCDRTCLGRFMGKKNRKTS